MARNFVSAHRFSVFAENVPKVSIPSIVQIQAAGKLLASLGQLSNPVRLSRREHEDTGGVIALSQATFRVKCSNLLCLDHVRFAHIGQRRMEKYIHIHTLHTTR